MLFRSSAKKLMIQQALWEKFGIRFPNHSLSPKTSKPIKFRTDIVDAVGQCICFGKLHLNLREVKISVDVPQDIKMKPNKTTFTYPEGDNNGA